MNRMANIGKRVYFGHNVLLAQIRLNVGEKNWLKLIKWSESERLRPTKSVRKIITLAQEGITI